MASEKRKKDWEEKMAYHLSEDERAVLFHERWMLKNEAELRLTEEELARDEQSGIEALEAYEAKKKSE